MNVDERIERRLRSDRPNGVVTDIEAITPVVHVDDPVGRGPVLERLLDVLDPAFAGARPPSVYVHGPKGSGKSAVVTTLFDRLDSHAGRQGGAIHTATRTAEPPLPRFVRVDARRAGTRFGLYHDALAGLIDVPVPDHGVGTDELATRLADAVGSEGVVVAIDHADEPDTFAPGEAAALLGDVADALVPVVVGRTSPETLDWEPETVVEVPAYERHALVDVLTARTTTGLSRNAVSHDQVREIAEWAEGDAHDALAALFGATVSAERDDAGTLRPADVDAGIEAVPKPSVSLGRVFALPENRKRVLAELVTLDEDERGSVGAATEAIAAAPTVDLTASTVRRVLYELAELDVLELVTAPSSGGKGRPPSRIVARFPTRVFSELFSPE